MRACKKKINSDRFRLIHAYPDIFRYIQAYSEIIKPTQEFSRDVQAHSEACVNQVYSEPWYI